MLESNSTLLKISVIVPVYNAEPYIAKCIDSILAQTYTNFELLLINDGSKDNSGDICDKYKAQDDKVKVIHKENGGVSSARNIGLDNATGHWIVFVDSDDWVKESYLDSFIDDIDANTNFIMHGKYARNQQREADSSYVKINTSNKTLLFEDLRITRNGQIASKLFKNSIIQKNNLRFNNKVSLSEDVLFILEYLTHVDIIKYRSIYNYFYELVEDSLSTTSKVNYESNLEGFRAINEILYSKQKLRSLKEYPTLTITYFGYFNRAVRALSINGYSKDERIQGYKELSKIFKFTFKSSDVSRHALIRFSYKLFKKGRYNTYDLLMRRIHNRGKVLSYIHSILKRQQ